MSPAALLANTNVFESGEIHGSSSLYVAVLKSVSMVGFDHADCIVSRDAV